MSAGSINGKPLSVSALSCSSLEVAGQPIAPSGVVSLAGTTGGAQTGAVQITGTGGVTVAGAAGVLTISGLGAGVSSITGTSGGAITGAVALTGTGGISVAGVGSTLTISGGSGAQFNGSAAGSQPTNATGTIAMSVSATAQTGILTSPTTIVFPPAGTGSGITNLVDAAAAQTTSLTPTVTVGTVTNTTAATSLQFVATANALTLGGNIQSSGGGGGPVAWGYVVVPASPGSVFSVYPTGGTAPAAPAAALVVQGGTLASSAQFTTSNFMTANWAAGTFGGSAATVPGGAGLAVARPGSAQGSTSISITAGTFTAGQYLYWVLWAL